MATGTAATAADTDEVLTAPPSPLEYMATVIAHDLEDGQWVEVGANSPVPRAGALLAHLTRGPNMNVMLALTKSYLYDEPVVEEFDYLTDVAAMRWAEAYYPHDRLLSDMKQRRNGVFFCGGIQFDRFGNSNLIGVGPDHSRLAFRGPGAIGTCNATVVNGRYHLIATSHSPRTLVERVDYISALGYGDGSDPDIRRRLGIDSDPRYLITPMCVFDFDPDTRAARLASVHPPNTVEEVLAATGFEVQVPDEVPETPGPTAEELRVLRTRLDTRGALR